MLAIISGALVGLALGLTGGGGSIIALPLLIYVLGTSPLLATTMSLAAVSVMAIFGAIEASRNKMIEWRASLILAAGGMALAPLGVSFSTHVSESMLVTGFAVLMLLIAGSMWYKVIKKPEQALVVRANYSESDDESGPVCKLNDDQNLRLTTPCGLVLILCGCVTGLLSGFFGVGGGFLIVPALTTVTQLNIHRAVASSLLIIALIGVSGVSSAYIQGREIEYTITGLFIIGGLLGMVAGRSLAKKISTTMLQKVFVASIILIATVTLFLNN